MNNREEKQFWSNFGYNDYSQGVSKMSQLEKYIDNCLIDEYANKKDYTLDVSSLPKNEIQNFLDVLMDDDTEIRDLILDKMQHLIDERLPEVEVRDRQNKGIKTHIDRINGEVRFYL